MAQVKVRHAQFGDNGLGGSLDRDFRLGLQDRRGTELAVYVNDNLHKYKTVVALEMGGTPTSILNETYALTNTSDVAWYQNPDILVDEEVAQGCRSTSIGDIIEIEGTVYVADGCGFMCLEDTLLESFLESDEIDEEWE